MQPAVPVLLVEDDEDDIALFQLALREQACPVKLTTLTEGDEVLPYLTTAVERPILLFLDLNLPRMDGREVLVQMKRSSMGPSLRVFILTTSSAPEDIDFCLANGAEQFLTKPTSPKALSVMLAEVFRRVNG